SFVEEGNELTAYILSEKNHEKILENIRLLQSDEFEISYSVEEIEPVNWNAEWEKNFSPITIENRCTIRAPFHENPETEFDIVIEPKMSFGTGHHATTYMMAQLILENEWNGKSVLDMGCGTGVLAILTEKKGAKKIDAIDIDNWCYQNTLENVERNNCSKIEVYEGGAELLTGKKYNSILANINRNILLEDMDQYVKCLETDGSLFLSGFYLEDLPVIQNACENHGLTYAKHLERNQWTAVKFVK
ncbi:MAG TPA: 50S ribosomal protein L11 methyltransferase, partial [Flavobacteriaceae bacterium]|nr:50S ribosomal protein L11 methyltransferase [Flavobacteriaceae bacterium]